MVVVKVVELIGSSSKSWEDATENVLEEASHTIREIKSIDVKNFHAKVKNNKIVEYRVVAHVAFVVEKGDAY
jgi:flavin-binding protein dodecin